MGSVSIASARAASSLAMRSNMRPLETPARTHSSEPSRTAPPQPRTIRSFWSMTISSVRLVAGAASVTRTPSCPFATVGTIPSVRNVTKGSVLSGLPKACTVATRSGGSTNASRRSTRRKRRRCASAATRSSRGHEARCWPTPRVRSSRAAARRARSAAVSEGGAVTAPQAGKKTRRTSSGRSRRMPHDCSLARRRASALAEPRAGIVGAPEVTMKLDGERLESLYTTMVKIRRFAQRTAELFVQGLVKGTAHSYVGEEAVAAAACANLREDDSIVGTHRGHGHCIAKGARADRMMAELFGRVDGYCRGLGGSMHIAALDLHILGCNRL